MEKGGGRGVMVGNAGGASYGVDSKTKAAQDIRLLSKLVSCGPSSQCIAQFQALTGLVLQLSA
jgi:hypothetical protein